MSLLYITDPSITNEDFELTRNTARLYPMCEETFILETMLIFDFEY